LAATIRPPGANRDTEQFLASCTGPSGCTACRDACPHDAIKMLGPAWGVAEGTPFMEVDTSPCHWCEPKVCIDACDSNALTQVADTKLAAVATVTLDLSECLVSHGTLCTSCSDFCPTSVRAMTARGREPSLDTDACVGCGLCVWHCDAPGPALTIAPPTPAYRTR